MYFGDTPEVTKETWRKSMSSRRPMPVPHTDYWAQSFPEESRASGNVHKSA